MDKDFIMRQFLSLVKDGGMIQWDEVTWPFALNVDSQGQEGWYVHPAVARLTPFFDFELLFKRAATLAGVFEGSGLGEVVGERPPVVRSNLVQETQLLGWTLRDLIETAGLKRTGVEGVEEAVRGVMRDIEEMKGLGGYWAYPWIVVVGRKRG